ncbi:MAG: hypothetical protein ACR2GR_08110 [Rhodothermales bacterium]
MGLLELVTSAAHEIENAQNPYPEPRTFATDVLSLTQHRVASGSDVAERTAAYAQEGLTRLDAFHLAAAVTSGAAFFCTTNDRLLRRGRTLNTDATAVVSPLDLLLQLDLP